MLVSKSNIESTPFPLVESFSVVNSSDAFKAIHEIKVLGVWLNQTKAHVIEYTSDSAETKTLSQPVSKEEKLLLNKRTGELVNRLRSEFYGKLVETIKEYKEVFLFGSTVARLDLLNFIRANEILKRIRITVKQSYPMTDLQQHEFVKSHFEAY